MPLELVDFYCPKHGKVTNASKNAMVECHCGEDCAPPGTTPFEHRKRVQTRKRVARARA